MMIPYPTQPDRCVALTVSGNQSEPANPLIRLDPVTGETTVVNPPTCRAPLVPNPNPALPPTAQRACFGACCISCPHLEAFFPPNKISSYLNVTDSLRAISAILSLFVLISYALLPGKRVHPTVILLWFVAAVFLFSATTFFNLGRRKATQCGDDNVSEADQGNNTTCAVQGAALFYASQASILWCAYLILNLHVTTVWNSHFFADKYPFIHTICWGVPLVVTAVGIYLKGVAFQFGSLCFLSSSRSSPLFFYPMSPFIFLGFAIHLWTVSYVARVAAEAGGIGSTSVGEGSSEGSARGESTRRRVMKIWRTSWRSMLLVTMFLTTFMYFWMFYFTQNDRVQKIGPGTPFITEWLKCILSSDGSQETCSNILTPHLPSYVVLVLADTFPSLMGIWLFIIFGLRGSIVAEWKEFFRRRKERNFVRDPTASGSEVVMGRWAVEEHVDRKGTREIRTNSRPQPSNSGFVKDSRSQHRYPPHSAPAYNSYMQSSSYDDAESAETTSSSVPMIRPTPEFVRPPPRPAGRRLE
ncbi:uncharacterized protein SPPG_01720 [Spizellomyces punctatus DAOM BR117]|uniref:G-protein coupled receptors family 2 profile 2 domain-containing protein n=1 Tax=Spizellomyces punctatus (strain DAOM BR117) TaxID=645134 RepID=A0A0L0HNI0_SPIPD|nr:uncharacterized protein SPPG_01720 [Spizellomyces punctatus DAOM BR117]KND02632.1 hypothetical protein SPPG_01720 [Spizellomyces punctatus DAOM BR117]|eukprot:XP_016610671.1 hypothetical protein SPPG_01720 [Spizellomyces punctatus DAOM BR117]